MLVMRRPHEGKGYGLQIFCGPEGADYRRDVPLIGVDLGVEVAHIGGGEFAREIGKSGAELGKFFQRGVANYGDGVVGREIVFVVLESDEVKRVDQAVGGITGDDVDLMIEESAVKEAEVHDGWWGGEVERVTRAPAWEAVGAFQEFVADTGVPLWGQGGEIRRPPEMETLGVLAADDHGEGVFKA